MRFHIDEDGGTESARSRRGCSFKNGNPDFSDKEGLGDNDGQKLCRSIGGKSEACFADCRCDDSSVLRILISAAQSETPYS